MSDLVAKLNKALKSGPAKAPSGSLRHDNEAGILESAKKLLAKSEVGRELLQFAADNGISIHVLRNKDDFGVLPDQKAVFISCPAGQDMPGVRAVIRLAGALREAMQETTGEHERPKSAKIGRERFMQQQMDQQKDMLYWQTAVVYEIHEAAGLLEIVDEYAAMGYLSLYEAYVQDLQSTAS